MKYLIKDTQLKTIIFEVLNDHDYFILENDGDYYFFESEEGWRNRGYALMAYRQNSKELFVSSDLLRVITGYFSLSLEESIFIISLWVESKLGLEISYSYSDYGAD